MKKLVRKAITVMSGAAMIGATVAMASAAAYPAPFDAGNTAIVVGANAAPSDTVAAATIASDLSASMVSAPVTVSGGESYKFEKTSTMFHLGDTITGVVSSDLDEDELPTLLAEGTYTDNDNDEFDYTQKISMEASQLTMFDDNDYKVDEPTIGFKFASGANVLKYTLEFSEEPLIADLDTTDLTIMGKDYYVLGATATKLTLLDSAADTIVSEGETVTVNAGGKTYTVSIEFVDSDSAKLSINGEVTNDIATTETYKLDDGSYLGMKEILYSAKDSGISKVEFSIGNGKLVLENGQDIEMNEENIDGMTSTLTNSTATTLTSLAIDWNTDDEVFVTEDSVATMPGFENIVLSFGGLSYPAEEEIEVGYDGSESAVLKSFPLKDSVEDINILYTGGANNFTGLGKDSDEKLVTGATSITFDGDTDSYFVASWTDGRDAESYLMRANNFKVDNSINKTTIQYKKDGSWVDAKTDRQNADTFSIGNAELAIGAIDKLGKSVVITNNSAETTFNTLYSSEGLKVILPSTTSTDAGYINFTAKPTTFILQTVEEDKDGDVAGGDQINLTIGLNSQTPKEVTVTTVAGDDVTAEEIGDSDVFRSFTYSALATEVLFDQGGDQDFVKLIYHGDEVAADVRIASADAVISSETGKMTFTDVESSAYTGKNLIVVGGSAVNSVAADLLGEGAGEAFTANTGVKAGEFLIESFNKAGKIATVVAGYNAEDTTKAAIYLTTATDVSTSAGDKYVGASATESATMVSAA